MPDLWTATRSTPPQSQALRYSYEKAGLTIDDQPIPWCAESVIVEALVRVGTITPRTRLEFALKLPATASIVPEIVRPDETPGLARLFFRFSPPPASTTADLSWRQKHSLGQTTIPVVSQDDFLSRLQVQHPTVQTMLVGATAACRTLVSSQARGLIASAVWSSPTSLAPLAELRPAIELADSTGATAHRAELMLSGAQLRGRQALASVELPKPTGTGSWQVRWILADRILHVQTMRAVTRVTLEKSLRLLGGRFLVQSPTGIRVDRLPPVELAADERLGPIFQLASSELGMAGRCNLSLRGLDANQNVMFELPPQEVLIRDGPTPFVPGTFGIDAMKEVRYFELRVGKRRVGLLSLDPAPTAHFDAEGSFALPTEDFAWSATAESQLQERLANLMGKDEG